MLQKLSMVPDVLPSVMNLISIVAAQTVSPETVRQEAELKL